jgi:hypothetical protein
LYHTAVHFECFEVHPGVAVHRVKDFPGLKSRGLEDCAGNMALVDEAGQADNDTAGIRAPIGRKET